MITTENINGRSDWFHAHADVNGYTYFSFEKTRHGAFMAVARQLMVAGLI